MNAARGRTEDRIDRGVPRMSRSIVSFYTGAAAAAVVVSLVAAMARADDAPASAPAIPAAAAAASRPAARPLTELFHADLLDRKLEITVVPADTPANRAVVAAAAAEDGPDGTTTSSEFNAVGEEKWLVQASSPRDRGRDGACQTFAVSCESRADDVWSSLQLTSVTRDADALTIRGGGRMGRGFVSITYRQDARLRDVRFTVQRPRRLRPRPLHEFAAQDLVQLFNEHQFELRQYLVPLLVEVCGRNPLRPQAGDVYRAFAMIPADAGAVEKVRALLPDLDAAAPPLRDAASAKLQALGAEGVLAAARIDRSELTPEQGARLDWFVARNTLWPDPVLAVQKDGYFLVDCLQDDDVRVRRSALEALRTLKGEAIAFDVAAAPAARAKAAEALYEKLDDERDSPPPEP